MTRSQLVAGLNSCIQGWEKFHDPDALVDFMLLVRDYIDGDYQPDTPISPAVDAAAQEVRHS